MRTESTPELNSRYWVAICAASMAGCNLGDFVSLYLHWGHRAGIFPLALLFGAVLVADTRAPASEAWYWAAIIVVRTAATNVADLATHTYRLEYSWVIAVLEALQVLLVLAVSTRIPETQRRHYPKPLVNGWYWASMMTAGILGTAIGDCTAETFGFGTGVGTIALSFLLALVLAVGFSTRWATKATYWFAVIAVRSAGTTAGDWLAFREGGSGLGLGLLISTCMTTGLFVAILVLWRPTRSDG